MNKPRLIFLSGTKAGQHVVLDRPEVTIGRDLDRDVQLPPNEVLVSAKHATVFQRDDDFWIRDHDSRNGTFVNKDRVSETRLSEGDVIELGSGGPSAQFTYADSLQVQETLDGSTIVPGKKRVAAGSPPSSGTQNPLTASREFLAVALRSGKRTRRILVATTAVLLVVVAALVVWNLNTRAQLNRALREISMALEEERSGRTSLALDLAALQSTNDSLQRVFESERRAVAGDARFGLNVTRNYSRGVALLVWAYAYVERGSDRVMRYRVDDLGQPLTVTAPNGMKVPQLTFDGDGPIVEKKGSATGFLIDSDGWILTNRHVARPWRDDADLERLRISGADIAPRLTVLRAYFPPGSNAYPLVVEAVSDSADVALLRSLTTDIEAPVVPLSRNTRLVEPGEEVVMIGYPTGVHNLMFRVAPEVRSEIVEAVGSEAGPVELAAELASRELIQPLVTRGSVSDTTLSEVIHTAEGTGGSSGGPIIGADGRVMAVHYAFVTSPIEGDPFRTQRGVKIGFAWSLLPERVSIRIRERGS